MGQVLSGGLLACMGQRLSSGVVQLESGQHPRLESFQRWTGVELLMGASDYLREENPRAPHGHDQTKAGQRQTQSSEFSRN